MKETHRSSVLPAPVALAALAFLVLSIDACGAPKPTRPSTPPPSSGAMSSEGSTTPLALSRTARDPEVLAEGIAPAHLVASGGWLYFIDGERSIARLHTTGKSRPERIAEATEQEGAFTAIAVDCRDVYIACAGGFVKRMGASGGARATLASEQERPTAIFVANGEVLWANQPKVSRGSQRGGILKVPASGGTPVVLAHGEALTGGFAMSGTSIFFATASGVMKTSTAAGSATRVGARYVAPGAKASEPSLLAIDGASLFEVHAPSDDHGIMNISDVLRRDLKDGKETVTRLQGGVVAIAGDGDGVFVATVEVGSGGERSTLLKVPKNGDAPIVVLEIPSLTEIAVDQAQESLGSSSRTVYVATNPGGRSGRILRISM